MTGDDHHWFLTLAETGRLTETADGYGLAQPTLSRRLQRLEKELGAKLFDRKQGRLALNAAGRLWYERVRRAQAELDAGRREIADLAGPSAGTVRLSFLHSFGIRLVPTLISEFRSGHPQVRFELRQDAAGALTRQVLDGTAELAVTSPRPDAPDVAWRLLFRQPLQLAVPADHPAAGRRVIDLAEVADQPFIALHAGYGLRRIMDDMVTAAGFRPRITFEASDLATVVGLVGAGLGVAVVLADQAADGAVLIPLRGPVAHREVGLIHNPAAELSRPAHLFGDAVVEWARRTHGPDGG